MKAPKHSAEDVQLLRENFQKGIALGFQAGPFDQPPHACARPSNVFLVPKHKYDPNSKKNGLCTTWLERPHRPRGTHRARHRDAPEPGSINALCATPRWLATYFKMRMLFDALAEIGPGVTMSCLA